jgi:hypothetical protein
MNKVRKKRTSGEKGACSYLVSHREISLRLIQELGTEAPGDPAAIDPLRQLYLHATNSEQEWIQESKHHKEISLRLIQELGTEALGDPAAIDPLRQLYLHATNSEQEWIQESEHVTLRKKQDWC